MNSQPQIIPAHPRPHRALTLFVSLALLLMAGMAQAALSAYEPFNYTAGTLANGTAATGTGFAGTWTCGVAGTLGTGLTYPGLPVAGNALSSGGGRQFVNFATPLSSGTKWISFLLTASANPGGNIDGVYFPNGNTTCLWFGWGLSPYSPAQGSFGIGSMTTAGTAVQGATSLSVMGLGNYASNTLIVLRIDFNTSGANDTITVYTNPVANVSAPGVTAAATNTSYDVGTISGVGLNVQGGASITVDEIRVGDTYGDVVGYVGIPPNPPTGVMATPGTNQVSLSWTGSSGATGYNIKRSATPGGPYTTVGTTTAPTVTYTDQVLGGQTYYYVVSAVNDGGESSNSSPEVPAAPTLGAPATPTGLGATPGNGQVALTWTGSSAATSYNVKRGTSSAGPFTTIGSTTAPTVAYTDSGLNNGTTYYYVVSAVNGAGESSNSSPAVSAKPVVGPATPTGVTATPGTNQVFLSWTASTGSPVSYNVKRGTSSAGPFTTIGSTTAPTVTYTDSGLTSGTTYYYVVSAVNGAGESANSSPAVSATPAGGPGILYNLSVTGPISQRLNFVIMGDGYTTNQASQFTNDAQTLLNSIFSHPPYSEYTNYFNVYAIFVASVDSGASHPESNIVRNTYFGSTFDTEGIERLLTISSAGFTKKDALEASLMPSYDLDCVVVNDQTYGGSGGSVIVTSMNSLSPEIVVHESGHTLGNLGDEYSYAGSGGPGENGPNITQQTNRTLIKWNSWINASTPIPTPDTDTTDIGLFQGANYSTNWYRPKYMCEMQSLGNPFCSVCSEALVKAIYGFVSPISTNSPATNATVQVATGGNATFTAVPQQPSTHNLSVQWSLNGVPVTGATNATFNLAASALTGGTGTLKATVWDTTPLVRNDPTGLLTNSVTWSVSVASAPPTLSIALSGKQAVLSWPTSAVAFTLESTTNFPGSPWVSNSGTVAIAGSVYKVTNSTTATHQFFRLQK